MLSPYGLFTAASTAKPPSPENPAGPVPGMVTVVWAGRGAKGQSRIGTVARKWNEKKRRSRDTSTVYCPHFTCRGAGGKTPPPPPRGLFLWGGGGKKRRYTR